MSNEQSRLMYNLTDTINGEINRMCVTENLSELDSMALHARKNIDRLRTLIYDAKFKIESEELQ